MAARRNAFTGDQCLGWPLGLGAELRQAAYPQWVRSGHEQNKKNMRMKGDPSLHEGSPGR